jgi:hypothetical protein
VPPWCIDWNQGHRLNGKWRLSYLELELFAQMRAKQLSGPKRIIRAMSQCCWTFKPFSQNVNTENRPYVNVLHKNVLQQVGQNDLAISCVLKRWPCHDGSGMQFINIFRTLSWPAHCWPGLGWAGWVVTRKDWI